MSMLPEEFCHGCGHTIYPKYRCRCDLIRNGGIQLTRSKSEVIIEKLHEGATIPTYAHETDAGFDLYAAEDVLIKPGEMKIVPTGLMIELPIGMEMQIRPRSGVSRKTPLRIPNAPGTIDAGYRGDVGVLIENTFQLDLFDFIEEARTTQTNYSARRIDGGKQYVHATEHGNIPVGTYLILKGDRIAQGVVAPVTRVNFTEGRVGESDRGEGGFGSSGTR